jgi:putative sigma-54 modulation protein
MIKISVKAIHFSADSKLIAFIEKRIQRLSKYFEQDMTAEVHLKLQPLGSSVQQKISEIHLHVPGGTWLVDKKANVTFEGSIIESVETLKRQLIRHKERLQGR